MSPSANTLIIIPARDEALTIGRVISEARAATRADILVVDDQSTDKTAEIAADMGAMVMRPAIHLGAWGAIQAGFRLALKNKYECAVTMDADGQHLPGEVDKIILPVKKGACDVLIGAFPERASRLRKIAWSVFRRISGFGIEDLTSGFKVYNQKAMRAMLLPEAILIDYQDVGPLLIMRSTGLVCMEIPVRMKARSHGKSRIFSSWFKVILYMTTTMLLCCCKYNSSQDKKK